MMMRKNLVGVVFAGVFALALVGCESKEPARPASAAAGAAPSSAGPDPSGRSAGDAGASGSKSIHAFTMKLLDGTPVSLSKWSGKVLLVVNTASECGYTPQYEGLEALHERYESKGFAVLGFPSNDFGGQEPGSSEEIATFCKSKYGVTFPMFEKVSTTGPDRSELYATLAKDLGEPKWNFHKYLVDKHGTPVDAYPSSVRPDSAELAKAIEAQLAAP